MVILRSLLLAAALVGCAEKPDMRPLNLQLNELVDDCRSSYPDARWVSLDEWQSVATDADATLLVDVRTPAEQAVSHIPGSLTVEAFERLPAAQKQAATVLAYCTVGCRSGKYTLALREQGIRAHNLSGGVLSWALAGREFEAPDGTPTLRVHTYARRWAVVPEGYEAVF